MTAAVSLSLHYSAAAMQPSASAPRPRRPRRARRSALRSLVRWFSCGPGEPGILILQDRSCFVMAGCAPPAAQAAGYLN